ncbi:MAG: integrase, partial [Paracoccaceae bacterium]
MTETPQKSPSDSLERPDRHERYDSADMERDTIALPSHVAGSGTLDRLIETARDYARQAASENTRSAYAKDWAHFARWCRMRGVEPLPASPPVIGLYI